MTTSQPFTRHDVSFGSGEDVWEHRPVQVVGGKVSVTVEPRDAAVIALH